MRETVAANARREFGRDVDAADRDALLRRRQSERNLWGAPVAPNEKCERNALIKYNACEHINQSVN